MQNLSAVRKVRRGNPKARRCGRSTEKQSTFSPIVPFADGFLKQQFLPLIEYGQDIPERKATENSFFESLAVLSELHNSSALARVKKPYPYNILLAHHLALQEIAKSGQETELSIIEQDNGSIALADKTTYATGNTLYYIPVIPLCRLLRDKKKKQSAGLLLSVFAYLYHSAGIPFYRDDYSALAYHYECIEDWLLERWEEDEKEEQQLLQNQLNKALYYGDSILRKIYNNVHIDDFRRRIESFTLSDDFGLKCLSIAKKAFGLLEKYPNVSIFKNTSNEQFDEYDGVIHAQQYISFIADNDGLLYQNIERAVNDEFNECCEMEQPSILTIYDKQNSPEEIGLDFEYLIFPLISDLCTLLNEIP